ncbi:MAG: PKD domain-containing protein, partial [Nonlabens sp.]|nr:PKD domain-containing protein [Nonlabens sp.]
MKKLLLFLTAVLALSYTTTAQEFRMGDGRFTTCSGDFVDSGGATGNYSNSENSVITFCSPFPTDKAQVSFTSIALASGDLLFVYDGDAVAGAPLRVITLGANGTTPIFTASAANTSGCLTFRFISDTTNNAAGWNATLACIDNCQAITSAVTTTPAPDADGILRICQGETVNFVGTGNFSVSGANATYKYILSDGTEVAGTTTSQTYAAPGIYKIDFVVTDPMNCRDRSLEDVVILVSTTPDFTGTAASATDICFGDQVTINGQVTTTQFFANVAPPISGQTFLPDGSGVSYQTCIDVSGFPNGRTFQNASDLLSFFINMEHSYLGDLDMVLIAPNGSTVEIKTGTGAGGNTFLGIPIDIDADLSPGVGFTYTFTEASSATQTLLQAALTNTTIPAGDYRAEDPFSNFIGTPLNGLWCLNIIDNLNSDNGYIFEWGINFNPAIIPTAGTFTPGEVTEVWQANADIISTTGTNIVVQPSQAGQNCYVFELTDDFGCTYSETVCINVAAEITSVDPTDIVVCQNTGAATVDLTSRATETLNGLDATTYTVGYYTSQADADAQTAAIASPAAYAVTANETVFIRISDSASSCYKIQELDIIYSQAAYNQVANLELCDDLSGDGLEVFDLTAQTAGILGSQLPSEFGVTYFTSQADADANSSAITTPDAYPNTAATQTIFARVSNLTDADCFATGSFTLTVRALPQIGAGADLTECDDSPIDESATFDLSVNDAAVLGGQSPTAFTITYHDSASSAEAGDSALNSSASALR